MLTRICPDCHGETRIWKSKYGGNDPDVWDAGPCPNDNCDRGDVPIFCEAWKCGEPAVRIVEDAPLCEEHAREAEAELAALSATGQQTAEMR